MHTKQDQTYTRLAAVGGTPLDLAHCKKCVALQMGETMDVTCSAALYKRRCEFTPRTCELDVAWSEVSCLCHCKAKACADETGQSAATGGCCWFEIGARCVRLP